MDVLSAIKVLQHTKPPRAPASGAVQEIVDEAWATLLQFLSEHMDEITEIAEQAVDSEEGE